MNNSGPAIHSGKTPLVSFIINTYNHVNFIEEAIESALTQTFPSSDMELIVVDDGSQDDTGKRVAKFQDQLTYVRKENGGQSSALNVGFQHARGEYFTLLDGDDTCSNNRIEAIASEFESYPDVGIILCSMRRWGDGLDLLESRPEVHNLELSWETIETVRRCSFGIGRTSLRRSILQKILPLPERSRIGADFYLLSMIWFGKLSSLPDHLTNYRYHEGNTFAHSKPELAVQNASYIDNEINSLREKVRSIEGHDKELLNEFVRPYEFMRDDLLLGAHTEEGTSTRSELLQVFLKQISVYRHEWSLRYRLYKYLRLPLLLVFSPKSTAKLRDRWWEFQKRRFG